MVAKTTSKRSKTHLVGSLFQHNNSLAAAVVVGITIIDTTMVDTTEETMGDTIITTTAVIIMEVIIMGVIMGVIMGAIMEDMAVLVAMVVGMVVVMVADMEVGMAVEITRGECKKLCDLIRVRMSSGSKEPFYFSCGPIKNINFGLSLVLNLLHV